MSRSVLMTVLVFVFCSIAYATEEKVYARFEHFSTKDGLVSNRVFSLTQDSTGFVWIATDFGLERFDGIRFKHYQKKNYPSLYRDDILYVGQLGHNRIAVGGFCGVFQEYDRVKDDFIDRMPSELDSIGYTQIRAVYNAENGEQYLQTNGGVYRYNPQTNRFDSQFPAFDALKIDFVNALYVDQQERYWVGGINHLRVVDAKGRVIKQFDGHDGCGYVTTITSIGEGRVVVTFMNDELWIVNTLDDEVNDIQKLVLPFHSVMKMLGTDDGRFWFATDGDGLWYTEDSFSSNMHFKNLIPYGDDQNEIKKIYGLAKGNNGEIWLGTQNSGIWSYNKKNDDCVTFSGDIGFPTCVCSSFQEGENGTIYVGTDGNGIYSVSYDNKQIQHHELPNNNVTGIYKQNEHILTATWGMGILDFNTKTGKTSRLKFDGIDNPIQMFFSVGSDDNTKYTWACSANDDLYLKDSTWKRVTLHDEKYPTIVSKWIAKVIPSDDETLWVLSTNMLWKIDNSGTHVVSPELFLEKNHNPLVIFDAVSDKDGNLFTTSNHGIIRFDKDTKKAEILDFLPDCFYRIIQQDLSGRFWTASFDGILSFDYDEKEYAYLPGDYNDVAKSFFYIKAGFRDSKGRIYFGTNGGYYTFDPANIVHDTLINHLSFSELFVARKKIQPFTSVLEQGNITNVQKLALHHGQTDISITVDVIDHAKFNKLRLHYRLKGMQNDWINVDDARHINFNYIPTGNYVLEVEAYRPNINCGTKKISLPIVVLPPWWNTWWFRLLVGTFLLSMVVCFFHLRVRKLKKSQLVLQEKVDERTSELKQALKDKDRLISVIAHDLKNPMFAIVGALETLKNKKKTMSEAAEQQLVGDTYNESVTLQNEMLKLLDWAKSKRDEIICHPTETDLQFVVNNVVLLLSGMIDDKKICIKQNFCLTHYAFVDSRMMGAVTRNLLSNAVKFTPKNGTIQISGRQQNDTIQLEISDSGVGMTPAQVNQLLNKGDLSTRGTENEKGTGLGFKICQDYIERNNGTIQLKSESGKGTTVYVTLPASEKLITKSEDNTIDDTQVILDKSILEGNTLLVVDDDPLICNNIKIMMDEFMQTQVVSNGLDALKQAEEQLPDIILSDVDMPEMNGIELSKTLRKSEKTKHIPILFISAKNEESDRLLGLLSGAIDYIPKPFSQSELLLKLNNILKIRQEHQNKILKDILLKESEAKLKEEDKSIEENLNPFVKAFLTVIKGKYTDSRISIEDLAKEMAVSQPTLNRKIRSITGKSPLEVLTEYRLNTALRKLKDDSSVANISEVAYEVGFNDPSYFTKKFRDFFGYLPSKVNNQ